MAECSAKANMDTDSVDLGLRLMPEVDARLLPTVPAAGAFNTHDLFTKMEEEAEASGMLTAYSESPVMKVLTYAVHPKLPHRLAWDVVILILVLYSSVAEPYNAAFDPMGRNAFGMFMDAMFWADIVLSFWTGFDRGYEVEMAKGKIVRNYLGGWFLIDLAATVQWSWVVEKVSGKSSDSPFIRMARFLKVLRLARMSRLINKLTATWTLHSGFLDALKFFARTHAVPTTTRYQACH